jgi:REP element-mobilizing transposase RayT
MPRQAREKDKFCIYHVIQRGNNKGEIFIADRDRGKFIEILARMKSKYNFLVYAYCLMSNHIHLVIDDNGNDISRLIKSVNVSYALYFNKKYKRVGHLFQDRFKSEIITNDRYLLQVSKYIHNNPVKANMVIAPEEYYWSSYNIYLGRMENKYYLVDTTKILGLISDNTGRAAKQYALYVNQKEAKAPQVMDVEDNYTAVDKQDSGIIITVKEAKEKIEEIASKNRLTYEQLLRNKRLRNETIKEIREVSSLTLQQLGEVFGGLSASRVSRILAEK